MTQEKLERPMGVKLILAYNVVLIVFILSMLGSGGGGVIGLLFLFSLYYGLWRMKKDWMYVFVFLTFISTIYYIYSALFIDIYSIIFAILNSVSIYWLYSNKDIFIKPEKGKNALGTKSEWMRLGLIILGVFAIISVSSLVMTDSNYIIYVLLAIPIWIIFVWFFMPKIFGKKKSGF